MTSCLGGNNPFTCQALFDHTNGTADGYAQRLSGQENEVFGLAKSLSVMPGDVIKMEVYAKYIDANQSNHLANLTALLAQIAINAPGVVTYDGAGYAVSTSSFPFAPGLNSTSGSSGTGPKAYLNWLVFNKDYVLIPAKSGYKRMTTAGREYGQDGSHELLNGTINIDEPGYVYIYISNEEGASAYEVYFDDFKVDHMKSPVIQMEDYYAFGLTFNSMNRENTLFNQFQYNGKEKQDELDLGWLDYGARMYVPEIGRWGAIDYLSEKFNSHSPYNYVLNNPTALVDPDGNDVYLVVWFTAKGEIGHVGVAVDNYKKEEVKDKDGNVVRDENGNAVTQEVADGTATYYDFYARYGAGPGTHMKIGKDK